MRNALVLATVLVLCAGTAAQAQTQQPAEAAAGVQAAAAVAPAPPAGVAQQPAPSLYLSTDEIRRQVRAAEEQRAEGEAQMGSRSWWYLVAAIAVGVIIAVLVLD